MDQNNSQLYININKVSLVYLGDMTRGAYLSLLLLLLKHLGEK